jgi:hypothetical protein
MWGIYSWDSKYPRFAYESKYLAKQAMEKKKLDTRVWYIKKLVV